MPGAESEPTASLGSESQDQPQKQETHSVGNNAGVDNRFVTEQEQEIEDQRLPFLVAGVGAPAGGVEACIALFEQLPSDTGLAYVVILHLAPDQESHLPEILARHTAMSVSNITSGVRPEPNHIYVSGANASVCLVGGIFQLENRTNDRVPRRSIDEFFHSLASAQKNRSVGVVLSGMDGDGALGLKSIKGEGGITMVQSPGSARFPDMPRARLAADHVDVVLPPGALGLYLAQLGRQFISPDLRGLDSEEPPRDESHYSRIVSILKGVSGVNFRLYKPSTIRRRIARRMLLHHIDSLSAYEKLLRSTPREVRELEEDCLINVTRFFRDPDAFEILRSVVFPQIFRARMTGQQVRVWVAGCSSGEEVYSLAICMLEFMDGKQDEPTIQIFGTDASEENVQKARAGVYTEGIAANVSPERLRRFFIKNDEGFQVAKRVRDLCIFTRQNLCNDPPFSRMDLISCRNVLIYFGIELQRQIIPAFHYALRPEGFLLLGSSETIREFTDLFNMIDRNHKIFAKVGPAVGHTYFDLAAQVFAPDLPVGPLAPRDLNEVWGDIELQRAADRIVIARYAPPGVVINERMDILQYRGHTGPFFKMPQGPATMNLSRIMREEITPQLTNAARQAIEAHAPVQVELVLTSGANPTLIEILPVYTINPRPKCYLVLFGPSRTPAAIGPMQAESIPQTVEEKGQAISTVRQELASARLYSQSLLEERAARNQELVSANEEIQSANEELQSTNEELETTKEELQNSNEELQTVNDELQNRNLVLTQASNDFTNLLNSVSLPVLMLTNELNIRHFTPLAQRLMNVRPSDIGRPLAEIRMNLEIETLEPLFKDVLNTLGAREIEVKDREGRWHLLRVRPYRTVDDKVEGLVVVLVDIDQLRGSQQELRAARDFARLVLRSMPLPLVVVDLQYRIHTTNDAFIKLASTPSAELDRQSLPEVAAAIWGLDEPLRSHLAELHTDPGTGKTFEFIHLTAGEDSKALSIRGCLIQPDGESFLLITIENITVHTNAERQLQREGERLATEIASATRELGRNREELRALTERLFTTQEEERRRVGRELHDDVGQRLALLELAGAEAESQIPGNPEAAKQKVRELRDAIADLSRDVRGISHRLHPAMIEDLGLASALRALTDEFREHEHMITTFSARDVPEQVAPLVAMSLYRIAQEALRNVVRHAGKTHVKMSLRGGDNQLRLQVADAGHGFDSRDARVGLGLISMEERARQMGASFRVESALGEGTKITVEYSSNRTGDAHKEKKKRRLH